jgi:hypothetical protein
MLPKNLTRFLTLIPGRPDAAVSSQFERNQPKGGMEIQSGFAVIIEAKKRT